MTREEGIAFANKYDGMVPKKSLELFLDWLDMDKDRFYEIIDRHRNPKVWKKTPEGEYVIESKIEDDHIQKMIDDNRLEANDPREYKQTDLLEDEDLALGYILMGRQYIDEENFKAIEG